MRRRPAFLRQSLAGAVRASRMARPYLQMSLGLALTAGLFLAFSGAFGTGAAPLWLRLTYWLGVMTTTSLVALGIGWLLGGLDALERRPLFNGAVYTLLQTIALTPLVGLASLLAFGWGRDNPWGLLWLAPSVLVVSAAMTALNLLAARRRPRAASPEAAAAPEPRFLNRLPPRLRGAALYAIEAEDHYLRLHTSRGTDLILLRLADAMAELDGLPGAQTHRSWWVARDAVEGVRRGDGRATLTLKSGIEAPVSRTFARALRQQGWF